MITSFHLFQVSKFVFQQMSSLFLFSHSQTNSYECLNNKEFTIFNPVIVNKGLFHRVLLLPIALLNVQVFFVIRENFSSANKFSL